MRKTIAFTFALVGLFISIYLLWVYASPSHPLVCLGTGCDEVRASRFAHFFGVPTPAFGVAFYGLLAILMFAEAAGRKLHRAILLLAAIGFVVAATLTGVEAFVIHAWCAWCVGQAIAVTLILVLYATAPADTPRRMPSMAGRYWSVLMVAIIVGSAMFYGLARAEKNLPPPPPAAEEIASRLIRPDTHVTGNLQSPVTFVEFGDLQCPACAPKPIPKVLATAAAYILNRPSSPTPIAVANNPQSTISFLDRLPATRVITCVPAINPTPIMVLTMPNWITPACSVSRT